MPLFPVRWFSCTLDSPPPPPPLCLLGPLFLPVVRSRGTLHGARRVLQRTPGRCTCVIAVVVDIQQYLAVPLVVSLSRCRRYFTGGLEKYVHCRNEPVRSTGCSMNNAVASLASIISLPFPPPVTMTPSNRKGSPKRPIGGGASSVPEYQIQQRRLSGKSVRRAPAWSSTS